MTVGVCVASFAIKKLNSNQHVPSYLKNLPQIDAKPAIAGEFTLLAFGERQFDCGAFSFFANLPIPGYLPFMPAEWQMQLGQG